LDAQLSPAIARWLAADMGIDARPIRELGLRDAEDPAIFAAARAANAIVMTRTRASFNSWSALGRRRNSSGSRAAIPRTRDCENSCSSLGRASLSCCGRVSRWSSSVSLQHKMRWSSRAVFGSSLRSLY
jgi:hypothetical protein